MLVSPLPGAGITGALSVIDLFAQLLIPRNNPKGKIRGKVTHSAWLLTFEPHPPFIRERFILERLCDGLQFTKVDEGAELGATVVKIVPMHHIRVSLADVWKWLSNQEEQSYNLAFNNCKHFAYDFQKTLLQTQTEDFSAFCLQMESVFQHNQ